MVQEIRKLLPYRSAFCILKQKYPPVTTKYTLFIIIFKNINKNNKTKYNTILNMKHGINSKFSTIYLFIFFVHFSIDTTVKSLSK